MALLKNFTSGLKDIALNDQKFINSSGKVANGMHIKKELAERGIKTHYYTYPYHCKHKNKQLS